MTFGDFDPDDAFGVEPADPEQVAVKLQELRVRHGLSTARWRDLSYLERVVRVNVVTDLLDWLRRQGAS